MEENQIRSKLQTVCLSRVACLSLVSEAGHVSRLSRMQQRIGSFFRQHSTQDTYCLHDSVLKLEMAHCD